MGQLLKGRGLLRADPGREYRLDALDIAFASGLREQQRPGINLYGSIRELSLDDWRRVFAAAGGDNPELLEAVVLEVDHLQAYRRQLDSVVFEMRKSGQRLSGMIDASLVKGSFEYPLKPSVRDPVLMNLGYLNVEKTEHEDDFSELRPTHLPAMRLTGKALHFHDMLFSDLLIVAQPGVDNYEVSQFSMRRDALLLAGKAMWEYDPAKADHLSSIDLTVKGPGLGEAIAGLGFGNSMSSGTVDFNGSFSWPAPLPAFSLEQVKGDASLKITDGIMNNVEPGNGRFIGLLSLSALPRRLSLDFSDVLIEGMEFDEISGNYHISDGVLNTRNTRMDGPAAKIKISGKTGIIRRDYDQHIRVTPKIRQTLPLIGAVSAGTGVGWGLLLLQNLFKKVIDDAVEIEYRVTGSWDDPKVELIKAVDENQQEIPKIDK